VGRHRITTGAGDSTTIAAFNSEGGKQAAVIDAYQVKT
jgi:hypothetical protein